MYSMFLSISNVFVAEETKHFVSKILRKLVVPDTWTTAEYLALNQSSARQAKLV